MDAIDRDGTLLDVGCANGYLLQSILRWSARRLEPFGLDFSPRLIELARERLPQATFFVGDALPWKPPRRFDFVRTELVYASEDRQQELVRHLLVCWKIDRLQLRKRTERRAGGTGWTDFADLGP